MKFGVSIDMLRFGERKYEILKNAGFNSVDLNLANTEALPYTLDGDELLECLERERAAAEKADMTIDQLHGPWCWPIREVTPEGLAERLSAMKKCALIASHLGAKHMVIHPIMPHGINERADKEKSTDTVSKNIVFMSELAAHAKTVGVTVCLENMPFPNFTVSTPDEVAEIIAAVGMDNFKMCLDTGHAAIFKDAPPHLVIQKHKDIIKAMHVHDNRGKEDEHLLPLHNGVIDWAAFSKAIKESGYNGVFSLEKLPGRNLPDDIFIEFLALFAKTCKYVADMA